MANAWDALLNSNAQPVNMPTADLKESLGYGDDPNDDTATRFSKGLAASLYANSSSGRELTGELAKQRMAAKIALQLEQQKMQLAQQYPDYSSVVHAPNGAVIGFSPKGGQQTTIVPGSDLGQQAYEAEMRKKVAEGDPDVLTAGKQEAQAKVDLTKAQTSNQLAMPELRTAQALLAATRAGAVGQPKPPKPVTYKDARTQALGELGLTDKVMADPFLMSTWQKNHQGVDVESAINKRVMQLQGAQGTAPAAGGATSAPDASGLFNDDYDDDNN